MQAGPNESLISCAVSGHNQGRPVPPDVAAGTRQLHATLGGACRENAQHMLGSLCYREARYFMENIAARTLPPYDLGVDVNSLSERLVAFCVVGVDGLPRRQHEHAGMERVGSEQSLQLD
jgi:hypothetical protein